MATPFLKVFYIPNWLKSARIGRGKYRFPEALLYFGTRLQSKSGSGHRSHGGQGGTGAGLQLLHCEGLGLLYSLFALAAAPGGLLGGTIPVFNIYKSSSPDGTFPCAVALFALLFPGHPVTPSYACPYTFVLSLYC